MSVFNSINNALNSKLANIVSLPTIYWPNVVEEPTQGTSWLRPTFLPGNSSLAILDHESLHTGLYQVDIFTELKKGTYDVLNIADSIRDAYSGQILTNGDIIVYINEVSISGPRRVDSWYNCFVSITYSCIA